MVHLLPLVQERHQDHDAVRGQAALPGVARHERRAPAAVRGRRVGVEPPTVGDDDARGEEGGDGTSSYERFISSTYDTLHISSRSGVKKGCHEMQQDPSRQEAGDEGERRLGLPGIGSSSRGNSARPINEARRQFWVSVLWDKTWREVRSVTLKCITSKTRDIP
jgi:hypothetical protein